MQEDQGGPLLQALMASLPRVPEMPKKAPTKLPVIQAAASSPQVCTATTLQSVLSFSFKQYKIPTDHLGFVHFVSKDSLYHACNKKTDGMGEYVSKQHSCMFLSQTVLHTLARPV